MLKRPTQIEILWKKELVTYESPDNEILQILNTDSTEHFNELIKDIPLKGQYAFHIWKPRSLIYPYPIKGLIVSKKKDTTYYVYARLLDKSEISKWRQYILQTIHHDVLKNMGHLHWETIHGSWNLIGNRALYTWIHIPSPSRKKSVIEIAFNKRIWNKKTP